MGFNDFFGGMFDIDGDGMTSPDEAALGFLFLDETMDEDEDSDDDFDLDFDDE